MTFDGKRCVHSRNCVLGHPKVFVPNVKGEWIFPDAADAETVLQIGFNCPSGAIRVARNDGAGTSEMRTGREHRAAARERPAGVGGADAGAAACRVPACGPRSAAAGRRTNKPYLRRQPCRSGLHASGEAVQRKSAAGRTGRDGRGDAAEPDGPLKIVGNLEIVSGTGQDAEPGNAGVSLPLRAVEEQAVLRRQPQSGRLHRGLGLPFSCKILPDYLQILHEERLRQFPRRRSSKG